MLKLEQLINTHPTGVGLIHQRSVFVIRNGTLYIYTSDYSITISPGSWGLLVYDHHTWNNGHYTPNTTHIPEHKLEEYLNIFVSLIDERIYVFKLGTLSYQFRELII